MVFEAGCSWRVGLECMWAPNVAAHLEGSTGEEGCSSLLHALCLQGPLMEVVTQQVLLPGRMESREDELSLRWEPWCSAPSVCFIHD